MAYPLDRAVDKVSIQEMIRARGIKMGASGFRTGEVPDFIHAASSRRKVDTSCRLASNVTTGNACHSTKNCGQVLCRARQSTCGTYSTSTEQLFDVVGVGTVKGVNDRQGSARED